VQKTKNSDEDKDGKFINSKDFFDQIADYVSKVDEFLKSNIFSYHQILKNSMLKQIESNSL